MSPDFETRLRRKLPEIIGKGFKTPFHVYDEIGIRETAATLKRVMPASFREFYAVKALPDPPILRIMKDVGFGFDCSSEIELLLARQAGAQPGDIFFTSNNTTRHEFEVALKGKDAIINLDDIGFLNKEPMRSRIPNLISLRINPGDKVPDKNIIGTKYGVPWEQMIPAFKRASAIGAYRFGIHTMVASNQLDYTKVLVSLDLLLEAALLLKQELDIEVEFVNIGGGIGIPYRPEDAPFDFQSFGSGCKERLESFQSRAGFEPVLYMENGRSITGPHGVLVNRAINEADKYGTFIGVQCAMPALMRPGMYGAYHHITVLDDRYEPVTRAPKIVSVVGPICEGIDRLATDRSLPSIFADEDYGDLIITHDTGAHGAAMGFQYNGRPRPGALLITADDRIVVSRRPEGIHDLMRVIEGL
jgi:diaminopimelate decarboxylase